MACAVPGVATGQGEAPKVIAARLREASRLGLVLQQPDGRWTLAGRLDSRLRDEQELPAWAAEHRADFGAWGHGHRVVAHLGTAETARFAAEYRELVSPYRLLHVGPAAGTREVGIRCYTSPMPPASADAHPGMAADPADRPAS